MLVISAMALATAPAFAQGVGGPAPIENGPGSISAGSASTPERLPWTAGKPVPRNDLPFGSPSPMPLGPPSAPAGVDPRTGQPVSTIDPRTGTPSTIDAAPAPPPTTR